MKKNKYLYNPIYSTGRNMRIRINGEKKEIRSNSQHIVIVESQKFGKILVIDNVVQCAEKDHEIYDKAILEPLSKKDKKILLLGAGSGYVASLAIKKNPKIKIIIVDLDSEVVKMSKKFLGQKVFERKNVKLFIKDAIKYLEEAVRKKSFFCGIICDLTDTPIGAVEGTEFKKFYEKIILLSQKCLRDDGWMSIQAGAAKVSGKYVNGVHIIDKILKKEEFKNIFRKDVMVPSFGEKN